MKASRPIYLNLLRIRLPLPGLISILHRLSGIVVFLLLPLLLILLSRSLQSPDTFNSLQYTFTQPILRFLLWVVLSALLYHLIAGIRHLFMDIGIGESLKGGRLSAYIVLILSAIVIIRMGIWLW